jgi:hypothetical protein
MVFQDIYNRYKMLCHTYPGRADHLWSVPKSGVSRPNPEQKLKNIYFSICCKGHGMLMYFGLNEVAKGKAKARPTEKQGKDLNSEPKRRH